MKIDTDRFIVCSECTEADHYGDISKGHAAKLAKRAGWKTIKGEPVCPECQEKLEAEDEE